MLRRQLAKAAEGDGGGRQTRPALVAADLLGVYVNAPFSISLGPSVSTHITVRLIRLEN
jgi:hypothetical protein